MRIGGSNKVRTVEKVNGINMTGNSTQYKKDDKVFKEDRTDMFSIILENEKLRLENKHLKDRIVKLEKKICLLYSIYNDKDSIEWLYDIFGLI